VDAFGSGDAGPIGYVEEGELRMLKPWPSVEEGASSTLGRFVGAARWPRVEIVTSHAGSDGAIVRALVAQGVDGLVVAATGNGTVHRDLERALHQALLAGVKVVRSTRCAQGRVLGRPDDSIPNAGGLSPVKARIALMFELLG
jgi:L-asparaginase